MRLWHSGLEANSLDIFGAVTGSASITNEFAHTGNYSLKLTTDDIQQVYLPISGAHTDLYTKFDLYITSAPTVTSALISIIGYKITILMTGCYLLPNRKIRFFGSTYGSYYDSRFTVPLNTWTRIENRWRYISSTSYWGELRINGVLEMSYAVQHTHSPAAYGVKFGAFLGITDIPQPNCYIDDIVVNNNSGTVNNSWPGACRIYPIRATGAGTYSQFTASTGQAYQCISDGSESSYIHSSTAGHISTFTTEDMPDITADINAVQLTSKARLSTRSSSLFPQRMVRSGSTDSAGDSKGVGIGYRYVYDIIEQNPNTSANWKLDEIDAIEIGVKAAGS